MIIHVTGRNTTVKDSFKQTLEKKLSKLERFFDENAIANVTVINEGGRETVEITVKASSMFFRAEKTTSDRLDSLDEVVDALFGQIIKNKTKLEKRLRKAAFEPAPELSVPEDSYEVVRYKRFILRPMDVEEAILQMNMLGHTFFMFRNVDGGEINVAYRRNDGKYGVLEPDEE